MSHYVKANGKSVHASRGVAIDGWYLVEGAKQTKAKAHLFFDDASTGCRAMQKMQKSYPAEGQLKDFPRCAFCVDVDARYKRDAGVELYDALEGLLKEPNDMHAKTQAAWALRQARNRKV